MVQYDSDRRRRALATGSCPSPAWRGYRSARQQESEGLSREESDPNRMISRALKGDRGAFETLVARYEKPAWSLARRIVGDREVAAEMVQEAFLRVHEYARKFEEGREFEPWFYRILTNLCLNAARQRRRGEVTCDPAAFTGLAGPAITDPGRIAEERDRDEKAAEAFDALPPRYRAALALRVHGGMSMGEIALTMECPEGTVKTMLFRAREILRARMAGWRDEKELKRPDAVEMK